MKRIILLFLIFICVPFFIIPKHGTLPINTQITIENSNNKRDSQWEYVKNRLFNGKSEFVFRINGPILIVLDNATKQDSIAVEKTISELKKILPNKTIDYFKNYTKVDVYTHLRNMHRNGVIKQIIPVSLYSSVITFTFNQTNPFFKKLHNTSVLDDLSTITREVRPLRGLDNNGYKATPEIIYFDIHKNVSQEKRFEYIQYEFFRWLCYIQPVKNYSIKYIESGIFNTSEYLPEFGTLNSLDKFLLQKLYSDDFIDEFNSYLFDNYPWRYAILFINKNYAITNVYVISSILAICILLLSFSLFKDSKFKYSYLNYFFPLLILNLSLIYFAFIYIFLIQLDSPLIWESTISGFMVVIVLSFSMSFILWVLERLFIKQQNKFGYQIILQFIFTLATLNILPFSLIYFKGLNNSLEVIIPLIIFFTILSLLRCVYIYFNHYSENLIKQKDVELSQLKELQAATELNSLHAQINPHFLYNALNSIASLAHINAKKTEEMALSLSDLFKYSINRKGEKLSTIKDEVEMVENYLKIEKIRFEDRLEFSVDVEPSLLENKIPRYVLQPLIENAVKHGTSNIEGKGNIHLNITKNNNNLLISVGDNGPDFPDGLVSGHGLQSVYDLLRLSYGEHANMNWENSPKKKITISIRSNS
ncbi:MAG: histidine kinase [Flavobacteriaceae bacterium]|nr:histidine kinase [Flavobacteriaceae bacterium]